jgi:hypothetical protein
VAKLKKNLVQKMTNYLQTKFKYLLLLGLFILPSVSFAITVDPASPLQPFQSTFVSCTLGGQNLVIYDSTGNLLSTQDCNTPQTATTETTKYFVEWSDGLQPPDSTYTAVQSSPYYLGSIAFTWQNAIPYNPSLFGTMTKNPASLLDDLAEITRQHMWGGIIGWIILSLGIYTGFWLALALISMIGTAFRNDRERSDRINRLADNAIAEAEAFDRKHPRS